MSEILQIRQSTSHVSDVTNIQFHTYTPYTTSYNNDDEIRIAIQSRDLYVLPSESYLFIELKASYLRDLQTKGETDTTMFSYTSALGLFSEMRYELNGIEIDRCKLPMITTQLKIMAACKSSDYNDIQLLTWLDKQPISDGSTYQLIIPLKFVFGFCDDYNKILLNSKHELVLMRSHVDTNVYISNRRTIKFDVTKIHWKIPHVTLSNHAKSNMLKVVDRKETLPLAFRSWDLYDLPNVQQTTRNIWSVKTTTQMTRPRYVMVAFQTNRNAPEGNPTNFDHCNITNLRLYLNNERYPYDDLNLGYSHGNFCETINALDQIQMGYYNGTQLTSPITVADLIRNNESIVFYFDCSRSDDNIQNGMVDVRIEMSTRENFPSGTTAYCLVIHDDLIDYCPATGIVNRISA